MIKDGIYRSDADYMKRLRGLDLASLHYTIKDCREAIEANPENPNCGYYQDEIHYCHMEIARREKAAKVKIDPLREAVEWIVRDMAYKAPEQAAEALTVYHAKLSAALKA